jgi:hypothetical protein
MGDGQHSPIYDLGGRRLSTHAVPSDGQIYITQGRKMLHKRQ